MVMHLLTEELSLQVAGTALFILLRVGHMHMRHVIRPAIYVPPRQVLVPSTRDS
jgi:hypothetical protein